MSSAIDSKQKTILALKSGNRCALCREPLTVDATETDAAQILGYVAHIKGEKPGSARFDALQDDEERNLYPNLVYACGRCHPLIDKQESTYTVEVLQDKKETHEAWVHARLEEGTLSVGFVELEIVARFVLAQPHNPILEFTTLPPETKMQKNNLGLIVRNELLIGYGKEPEVEKYIDHMVTLDPDFPERLKSGFVYHYQRLRNEGYASDALFFALRNFASMGSIDVSKQAAGLSLLAYLFQKCEVFER